MDVNKKIDCTVIGDAMLDFMFPLTNSEELKYFFHGGVTSTKSNNSAGGTATVAVNIAKLSGKSAFIGKIGDDCFGKIIKNDLRNNNVIDCMGISENHKTGVAFIIVQPNKERFFIVDRGANSYLEMDDINLDLILKSKFLYLSGYSFQDKNTSQTIKSVIKEVSGKVDIVFNPAAPNIANLCRNDFLNILKNDIDILILNEKESYELLCGKDIFEELLPYVDIIALTKGERGSIVATRNETLNIKAHNTIVADTTGAGDAYSAGFVFALTKGWNLEKAGNLASKIAAKIVSQVGAR